MRLQRNIFLRFNIYPSIILMILLISQNVFAQKPKGNTRPNTKKEVVSIISFEVLENGDTINKLDSKNVRHGRWLIEQEARYEEPGTMEVGNYDAGLKIGKWQKYTNKGILLSEEFYKRGLKDGEARYYEDNYLICVGNYLALNAKKFYDTVMVEDAITNELKPVRIKTDVGSIKHGTWTFYEPQTKKINRVIEYQADEIIYDKSYNTLSNADSVALLKKMKSFPHVTNKPDENVWMQKGNGKRIKYTDIPDNVQYVKPNERRK